MKSLYKSIPTYRKYEDYILATEYTRGWNDAIDFIFAKEKREEKKEKLKNALEIVKGGAEE